MDSSFYQKSPFSLSRHLAAQVFFIIASASLLMILFMSFRIIYISKFELTKFQAIAMSGKGQIWNAGCDNGFGGFMIMLLLCVVHIFLHAGLRQATVNLNLTHLCDINWSKIVFQCTDDRVIHSSHKLSPPILFSVKLSPLSPHQNGIYTRCIKIKFHKVVRHSFCCLIT